MAELERYDPSMEGKIAYEHWHRYAVCQDHARGLDVLDVASGEGYGSAFLSRVASRVVGLEIDNATVQRARGRYHHHKGLSFEQGDCRALPFPDGSFDLVVSMETFEHIVEQRQFIAEVRRVLRPNGVFIVSTPNRSIYSEETGQKNPFHLHEVDEGEFYELLSPAFGEVQVLGQRLYVSSLIGPMTEEPGETNDTRYQGYRGGQDRRRRRVVEAGPVEIEQAEYMLAFCSNAPINWPAARHSVYIDATDDLWRKQDKVLRWASGLHDEDEALRAHLRTAQEGLSSVRAELADTRGESAERETRSQRLAADLETTRCTLDRYQDAAREHITLAARVANRMGVAAPAGDADLAEVSRILAEVDRAREVAIARQSGAEGRERLLEEMVTDLRDVLARSGRETRHAQAESLASRADRESLLGRVDDLQNAVVASRDEATRGQDEARAARDALEVSGRDNDALRGRLIEASAREALLAADLSAMREMLRVQQEREATLDDELASERRRVAEARATLRTVREDVALQEDTARRDADRARVDRSEGDARLEALGRDLQRERARHAEHVAKDRAERLEREAQLDALTEALDAERARVVADGEASAKHRERTSAPHVDADRGAQTQGGREALLRQSLQRELGERRRLEQTLRERGSEMRSLRRDATRVIGEAERLRLELWQARRIEMDFIHAELSPSFEKAATGRPRQGGGPAPAHRVSSRARQAIAAGNAARDAGDFGRAAQQYRVALGRAPALGPIWVQYGHMLKETGDYRGGEAAYLRAIEEMPEDADAHRQLGHVRKLSGDFKGALDAYTRASELDPTLDDAQREMEIAAHGVESANLSPEARDLLDAANEARDRGDWRQAAERFGRLLRVAPHMSTVWIQYGHALKEAGHGKAAVQAYGKAVALRPDSGEAWLQLGDGLRRLGDVPAARTAFLRSLALQPASAEARAAVAALGDLAGGEAGRPSVTEDGLPEIAPVQGLDHQESDDFGPEWPVLEPIYWLPQRLRDLLVDRYGEATLPRFAYLMGLVDRFADDASGFRPETDGKVLIERIRQASAKVDYAHARASIVIPVYNNLVYTLTCIASILDDPTTVAFEIIVGDDRSTDDTSAVLGTIGGCVRVVRHDPNLGFLKNCNMTAEAALGDYVVMLNNDTLVLPGWLDALIGTFDSYPEAGFAGSKLINGDGTLQEAGGIFWRDGSAWNFGRNGDSTLPEFNYVKEVDYVSGASIALPMTLWTDLGGFDPTYSPAYCEDADIAFQVRARGYRTLYQPRSALIHHEGRSHGRDLDQGIKAYQVINQQKLFERWQATLEADHFPNAMDVFVARDRSRYKPHILVIDHYIPQWDRDAGSRSTYLYIKLFCDHGFQVTLWPDNLNEDREYCDRLQQLGVEVIYSGHYHNQFPRWIEENKRWVNYAFVNRPHIAEKYVDALNNAGVKVLFYGHDLHFRRTLLEYDVTKNQSLIERARNERELERLIWSKSQVVLYPSAEEIAEIGPLLPPGVLASAIPVTFVPDDLIDRTMRGLDLDAGFDPQALMFVGGFNHPPNVDAVVWFVETVMPLLRGKGRTFVLRVAGSNLPDEIKRLAGEDVHILGRLSEDELQTLYTRSGLALLPLRYGGGVKGKLIEAFANGKPVVSTSVGVQGIEGADDIVYRADGAEAFANAILRAAAHPEEALGKARGALAFLRRHHSTTSAAKALAPHVPELA